jgi:hypothetical protein
MDQALTRLYQALFTVGFFDGSAYQYLGWEDVATPEAQKLAYTAAAEGRLPPCQPDAKSAASGCYWTVCERDYANAGGLFRDSQVYQITTFCCTQP